MPAPSTKDTLYAGDPEMERAFEDELSMPTRLPRVTPRNSIAAEAVSAASKETPYANVRIRPMMGFWNKPDDLIRSSDSSQSSSRSHQHH